MIKFKETARNKDYGKFRSVDDHGREKDIDLLDLKLQFKSQEILVRELFTVLAQNKKEVAQLKEVIEAQNKLIEKVNDITKLLIILNGEIEKLKNN